MDRHFRNFHGKIPFTYAKLSAISMCKMQCDFHIDLHTEIEIWFGGRPPTISCLAQNIIKNCLNRRGTISGSHRGGHKSTPQHSKRGTKCVAHSGQANDKQPDTSTHSRPNVSLSNEAINSPENSAITL